LASEIKERAEHEENPAEYAPAFKADEVAFLNQAVEFDQAGDGEKQNQRHEDVVGDDAIAGKQGKEDDRPECDGAGEAAYENLSPGGWRRRRGGGTG